jgi:cyclophilin family peptidyl-prolyl cis-trans isomerase/HEAT repeat protein
MRSLLFMPLLLCGCATTLLEHVAELEDHRVSASIEPLTRPPQDDAVRKRAFLALGRIQDARSAQYIVEGLHDDNPRVREEAAFAAGLLGLSWQTLPEAIKDLLATRLNAAEEHETDAQAHLVQLDALGRVGHVVTLGRLFDRLQTKDGAVRTRAMLALGVAVKRGGKLLSNMLEDAVERAAPSMAKEAPRDERYAAAYLLAVSKVPAAHDALFQGLDDEDAEIRALCAKGLGELKGEDDLAALKTHLADVDVRVAVEAVRSLVKRGVKDAYDLRAPVVLALAQAGVAPPGLREQVKDDALDCRLAAAMDREKGVLNETLNCRLPEAERLAMGLHALAEAPTDAPLQVVKYLAHKDARVQLAALDVLGEAKALDASSDVRPLLESKDLVVAGAAALALGKMGDHAALNDVLVLARRVPANPDIAPAVAEALTLLGSNQAAFDLRGWLSSPNATVRNEAAKAINLLTGEGVFAPEPGIAETPPAPQGGSGLKLKTTRGEIEIALWSDEAPRTSANFWHLAQTGLFNGLAFHRVVPDFVVQGGDPRGDGEGGPGYMIRCEVGHRPYARGTVGMALSGKDTGGSQFFITHTAAPHLDGRYTAFGQVTKGMDVVDALLEGDKILEATPTP